MQATQYTAVELVLRRDRLIVWLGLILLVLLSWLFLLDGAGTGMSTLAMSTFAFPLPSHDTRFSSWPLSYWLVMVVMWWVMMIAMMVPSAAPTVLLYGRVRRHNLARSLDRDNTELIATTSFLLGYLLAWLLFSVLATMLQWSLERAGLLHGMLMWSTSNTLSGGFLIAAGIYQLSALKSACLLHCRAPTAFLTRNWRPGRYGALRMGLLHGTYCLGCCWILMLLLFVGGVMNLVWIAGLAIMVLLEKMLPGGVEFAMFSGVLMLIAGLSLLFM